MFSYTYKGNETLRSVALVQCIPVWVVFFYVLHICIDCLCIDDVRLCSGHSDALSRFHKSHCESRTNHNTTTHIKCITLYRMFCDIQPICHCSCKCNHIPPKTKSCKGGSHLFARGGSNVPLYQSSTVDRASSNIEYVYRRIICSRCLYV